MKLPIFIKVPWLWKMAAITISPFIFYVQMNERIRVHETIHYLQAKELWYIGLMILYNCEFIKHFIKTWSYWDSYYAISFEREAYAHEHDPDYLTTRTPYAWRNYKE